MSKQRRQQVRSAACCPDLARVLEADFFKALGDPSRLAILLRLLRLSRPVNVSEVAACCPTDLSVVSRHLARLRSTGVVTAQRQGKEVYYSVPCSRLAEALRTMADAIEACGPGRAHSKRRTQR